MSEDTIKEDLKAEIKKMEQEKRKKTAVTPKDTKVTFDSWYHQRCHNIPKMHIKEVIMADFKARGVVGKQTMEGFDKALKLYGIEL